MLYIPSGCSCLIPGSFFHLPKDEHTLNGLQYKTKNIKRDINTVLCF